MSETGLPSAVLEQLRSVFVQYPELTAVRLFGSYATGRATPRSDIDLATVGHHRPAAGEPLGSRSGRFTYRAEVRRSGV